MATRTETSQTAHFHKHANCCHAPLGSIPKLPPRNDSQKDSTTSPPIKPIAAMPACTLLGDVCAEHDTRIDGKALIEYQDEDGDLQRVMASLAAGLAVLPGDKVLLVIPANEPIAVVTTVLARTKNSDIRVSNGLMSSESCDQGEVEVTTASNQLMLRDSDALQVTNAAGKTLLAIERGACGPIVRLGQGDLALDVPGEFHLVADSMRFSSRQGPVQINSPADDVIVKGRTIRLN